MSGRQHDWSVMLELTNRGGTAPYRAMRRDACVLLELYGIITLAWLEGTLFGTAYYEGIDEPPVKTPI